MEKLWWNYRIILTEVFPGHFEESIHEVRYNSTGEITSWRHLPVELSWEQGDDHVKLLEEFLSAFKHPKLKIVWDEGGEEYLLIPITYN